jgi:3-oxoacyl-[acyl-carrier protein] reductase
MQIMPTGRVAVVTGASRGIGRAIAVGLAEFGYDVAVLDLAAQRVALNETAAQIRTTGRKALVHELDVTSKPEIDATVRAILAEAGGIDVLVNNAGILKPSTLEDLSEKDWDAHFDVNIASIAGRQGVATQGHYAATKSTVITLTRVFAQEVGMDGITVNAICPGIILTEMGKNNLGSDEAIRHWETVASLKRLGDPEDIVGPVRFFASNQSDFVTGQSLNVCGGIYFH